MFVTVLQNCFKSFSGAHQRHAVCVIVFGNDTSRSIHRLAHTAAHRPASRYGDKLCCSNRPKTRRYNPCRWRNWINFGNKKLPRTANDNCSCSHFHSRRRAVIQIKFWRSVPWCVPSNGSINEYCVVGIVFIFVIYEGQYFQRGFYSMTYLWHFKNKTAWCMELNRRFY